VYHSPERRKIEEELTFMEELPFQFSTLQFAEPVCEVALILWTNGLAILPDVPSPTAIDINWLSTNWSLAIDYAGCAANTWF